MKIKPKIQIKLAISEKKERKRPGPQKKPKINEIIAIQNKQQRQNSPEPTGIKTHHNIKPNRIKQLLINRL